MTEGKPKRQSISKKLRFEVFKRDNFTCQYCGRMAPDVVLEVDHINPVANGGKNDILNLITSCHDCNIGKGKRVISENNELKKQQAQLKELSEKREQLEMLIKWRKELSELDKRKVDAVEAVFMEKANLQLMDGGRKIISKLIKKYGVSEVMEAVEIYIDSYFDVDTKEFERPFSSIGGICYNRTVQKDDPRLYWDNKIAYRCNFKFNVEKWKVRSLIKGKIKSEDDCYYLLELIEDCYSWSQAKKVIEEVLS